MTRATWRGGASEPFCRRGRMFAAALAALLTLAAAPPLAAKAPRYPRLVPGEEARGVIRPSLDAGRYRTFILDVPPTASAIRIRITESSADLDLFLRHGREMDDYSEADFYSEEEEWLEELFVYKVYETRFPSGRYFLDVAYQWDEVPRRGGEPLDEIPFAVEYDVIDAPSSAVELNPGTDAAFVLNADNLYLAQFSVDVPRRTSALRIDVLDTPGDVDLFLSRDDPAPERDRYLRIAETCLGRESIVYAEDGRFIEPGRYWLTVLEASETEHPVTVRITATLGGAAPEAAPRPPVLPIPEAGPETARLATVQLVNESGIGSGCLVSTDGLVITNHHVVADGDGSMDADLFVAISLDPFEAPVELFTAEILDSRPDDDLALLRITGDRWGRPLPDGYRFPAWRLGNPETLSLGDPLLLMGYPWMGSGLSRSYFTLTRGVLSGGERTPLGPVYKTDAVISGGSSGGAVTDGEWLLLGFPTFVVSQDSAQLSYFVPVGRIPRDWRVLFRYE